MTNRERASRVLMPLATTFTGVGGLVFHVGHGPEHLLCLVLAATLAVGGAFWSIWNRFSRRRDNFVPRSYSWCDQDPRPHS